ncbi:MAG: DUF4254 domain-containing protein [Methanoregula sp.]
MMIEFLQGEKIISILEKLTLELNNDPKSIKKSALDQIDDISKLCELLHYSNFELWNCEAAIRRNDISTSFFIHLKKRIDQTNLFRTSCIERIDSISFDLFKLCECNDWDSCYVNSETLGQLVDKLSILTLKIYSRDKYNKIDPAVNTLKRQRDYILVCYNRYINELSEGKGYMMRYCQFKKYEKSEIVKLNNNSMDI